MPRAEAQPLRWSSWAWWKMSLGMSKPTDDGPWALYPSNWCDSVLRRSAGRGPDGDLGLIFHLGNDRFAKPHRVEHLDIALHFLELLRRPLLSGGNQNEVVA